MKIVALLLTALIPFGFVTTDSSPIDQEVRVEKSKQIALAWFDSLMTGNTAVTTSLSDVPFALDRKQTIESIGELEKIFEQVTASKGKHEIEILEVTILEDEKEILKQSFPANYVVVFLKIEESGDGIKVCVKPGDAFKVVGLSD